MIYQIKLMNGDTFEVPKEEANLLSGKSGLVQLPSLGGLINISSITSVLPLGVAKKELSLRKQNSDGQWCVDPFKRNQWVLENDQSIKVDLNYYPEVKNKYDEPELGFEKLELENKMNREGYVKLLKED